LSYFQQDLRYYDLCAPAGNTFIFFAHIATKCSIFVQSSRETDGGGYIPSRLIKLLLLDKTWYTTLADVLREARAKKNCDSSMDDEDLQSRISEDTYGIPVPHMRG
jgi:hypothetical protein